MKKDEKKNMFVGGGCLIAFVIWTILIQYVDVKPAGQNSTNIGFATFNCWFHKLTDVNWTLYSITDWLGLVPVFICLVFAFVGLIQLFKRKNLFKVDADLLILGVHYIFVIMGYIVFEMIPINYRPVLINGVLEASYPSSTTLLVLGVMPTLIEQSKRRLNNKKIVHVICIVSVCFSVFMVLGRLISGVHWFSDIVGSVLLSFGLFYIYKALVRRCLKTRG